MAKMRMDEIESPSGAPRREREEAQMQNSIYDGRRRLTAGKIKPIIFRTTEEKRAQILRIADVLGLGKRRPISMTEVIERGIDALERELKGGGQS